MAEPTHFIVYAIDIGYRHFDCAHLYLNEKEIGAAIEDKIKDGTVKRKDLFITSKLWNTFHKKELVIPALKQTLEDLNLEYVDLYLIHWPVALKEGCGLFPKDENDKYLHSDASYTDTWKGMEECAKLGLAKSIGLSNFNSKQVKKILDIAEIKPVNNQSKTNEVCQAVKDAIDIGYRHFDCAHVYQNEKEVGAAINDKIKDGTIKREDLFITSKLWNTFHTKELVVPALKETLQNLNLGYIDLYLIHWPFALKEGEVLFPKDENDKFIYSNASYIDTWKGMEECVKLGLAKSIGLSNFNSKQIKQILDVAEIKPVNNQIECHPYLNQSKLIEFCTQNNITVTAYSPLGSPDRPFAKSGDPVLLEDPKLKAVSEKYNKSPAQILIKYQIQRNVVVIPKSVTKSRIASNFDVFDFTLSAEDMEVLNSLNKPDGRMVSVAHYSDHPDYPFNEEF